MSTNATVFATAWVPEPKSRGTWSILYSCVFTLTLCVWSAIHLNVPRRRESQKSQFWRKVKWVIIAIFAPEVVVCTAWQQYSAASRFCVAFDRLRSDQDGSVRSTTTPNRGLLQRLFRKKVQPHALSRPPTMNDDQDDKRTATVMELKAMTMMEKEKKPSHDPISLTYGFYVVMGGISVDVRDIYDGVEYLALDPTGVLHFARRSSWKDFIVDDDTIRDKSKADHLAKLLVILQVSWTFLQCVSRQVVGYPLTVLEVHTLVHAVCAMIMYGLWFNKPLNIQDSTKIKFTEGKDELALCAVRSPGSATKPYNNFNANLNWIDDWFDHNDDGHRLSEADMLVFDEARATLHHDQGREELEGKPGSNYDALQSTGTNSHEAATQGDISHTTDSGLDVYNATSAGQKSNPHEIMVDNTGPTLINVVRTPYSDADTAVNITTGQVLVHGIGPSYMHFSSKLSVSRLLDRMMNQILPAMPNQAVNGYWSISGKWIWQDSSPKEVTMSLSQKDMLRWERAARAFARAIKPSPSPNERLASQQDLGSRSGHQLGGRAREAKVFPRSTGVCESLAWNDEALGLDTSVSLKLRVENCELSFVIPSLLAGFASRWSVLFIGAAYATVHLILWDHEFPTHAESVMWKVAGCALGIPALLVFIVMALATIIVIISKTIDALSSATPRSNKTDSLSFSERLPRFYKTVMRVGKVAAILVLILTLLYIPLYCLARVYIVVESFISLRHVPIGVYETVTWAQYIPHF